MHLQKLITLVLVVFAAACSGARDAANAAQDAEFAANAEIKDKLLVEAEALVPVSDLEAAKAAFRDISDRWDTAGKVPREQMRAVLDAHPQLVNEGAAADGWAERCPDRPLTRFEQRGLEAGRTVRDLHYRRR